MSTTCAEPEGALEMAGRSILLFHLASVRVGLQTGYTVLTYLIFLNKCELDNPFTPRRDHFIRLSYNLDA